MDLGIKGKTALVVAASRGMGKASALGLAARAHHDPRAFRGQPQRARPAHALARRHHEGGLALDAKIHGTPLSDCADQDVCL